MALLIGQLLFATPVGSNVQVDLIVLDRPDVAQSPPIGAPLCLEFALPRDTVWRETMVRLLRSWAERLAVVHLDVLDGAGPTLVRVTADVLSVTLEDRSR